MITRRRRTNSGSEKESNLQANGHTFVTYSDQNSRSSPSRSKPLSVEQEMTCRDRTNEFLSVVKSQQSRQSNGIAPIRQSNRDLRQRTEFTRIAKQIGRDLANTFSKLEKLTILAKRKSIFDDKPFEIQELTAIIKQDLNNLNNQIAQLQGLAKSQKHGRHTQTHSNSVVVGLQSKLATMSNDFKQVLEARTEIMKQQKSRRDQFSESQVSASLPPSAFKGRQSGSVLFEDEMNSMSHGVNGEVAIDMDGFDNAPNKHQQLQLIDEQDSYIQSRAETMKNIESTIVELGSIFQQLAHMVKEQEEIVQRIDSNVEDTQLNVEGAHTELLKYFQSVTNNRWLMIKVFGILIVFFIIFVVFMA